MNEPYTENKHPGRFCVIDEGINPSQLIKDGVIEICPHCRELVGKDPLEGGKPCPSCGQKRP